MNPEWESSTMLQTDAIVDFDEPKAVEYVQDIDYEDWNLEGLDSLFSGELDDLLASMGGTEYCQPMQSEETVPQGHVNLPNIGRAYANDIDAELPAFDAEEAGGSAVDQFESVNQPELLELLPVVGQEESGNSHVVCQIPGNANITQTFNNIIVEPHAHPSAVSKEVPGRNDRPAEESDNSWNEGDRLEKFGEFILQKLNDISTNENDIEKHFITEHLPCKKRRLVHALAHIWHFNHMTLDRTKGRRILVSTANIGKRGTMPDKCWNEADSLWRLDPTTLIMVLPSHIRPDHFPNTMRELDLPVPSSHTKIAHSPQKIAFKATFNTAGLAATVLTRLQGKSQYSQIMPDDVPIDVAYRYWNGDLGEYATFEHFADANGQADWRGNLSILPHRNYIIAGGYPPVSYSNRAPIISTPGKRGLRYAPVRRHSGRASSHATDSSDADGYGSSNGRTSSKRSYVACMPEQENASSDSVAKRRRRMPKQTGGYACREPGCEKTFDFNGERTKHERIHKPKEEYPHACGSCDKRFIDKKDLKRHERRHPKNWLPRLPKT